MADTAHCTVWATDGIQVMDWDVVPADSPMQESLSKVDHGLVFMFRTTKLHCVKEKGGRT